jgi:hypothetical protein
MNYSNFSSKGFSFSKSFIKNIVQNKTIFKINLSGKKMSVNISNNIFLHSTLPSIFNSSVFKNSVLKISSGVGGNEGNMLISSPTDLSLANQEDITNVLSAKFLANGLSKFYFLSTSKK